MVYFVVGVKVDGIDGRMSTFSFSPSPPEGWEMRCETYAARTALSSLSVPIKYSVFYQYVPWVRLRYSRRRLAGLDNQAPRRKSMYWKITVRVRSESSMVRAGSAHAGCAGVVDGGMGRSVFSGGGGGDDGGWWLHVCITLPLLSILLFPCNLMEGRGSRNSLEVSAGLGTPTRKPGRLESAGLLLLSGRKVRS